MDVSETLGHVVDKLKICTWLLNGVRIHSHDRKTAFRTFRFFFFFFFVIVGIEFV